MPGWTECLPSPKIVLSPRGSARSGLSHISHRLIGQGWTSIARPDNGETLTCEYGLQRTGWTPRTDLRIRRLGVRVPPSAPAHRPSQTSHQPQLLPNLLPSEPSASEHVVNRIGSILAKIHQHVGVGVHRHSDLRVPEDIHDRPRRHARRETGREHCSNPAEYPSIENGPRRIPPR